jgi:hypothetical protein
MTEDKGHSNVATLNVLPSITDVVFWTNDLQTLDGERACRLLPSPELRPVGCELFITCSDIRGCDEENGVEKANDDLFSTPGCIITVRPAVDGISLPCQPSGNTISVIPN